MGRAAQAEARALAAEEKKAAAEARKREAGERTAQASKQAEQAVAQAKPRATISLFGFGQSPSQSSSPAKAAPKILAKAPRGVPVISNWKKERDGGISGRIFGSPQFEEGEFVSTSPITSEAAGGALVTTESGSKYFLEDVASAAEAKKRQAEEKRQATADAAEEKKREATEKRVAQAEARALAAEEKKAGVEAKKKQVSARQAVAQAKPSATISLFGFGQSPVPKTSGKVAPQKADKTLPKPKTRNKAPRGVPAISNWRQNRDGSISGRVFGSPLFDEGETITTSPITSDAIDGALVQTLSGSKYYLEPKGN